MVSTRLKKMSTSSSNVWTINHSRYRIPIMQQTQFKDKSRVLECRFSSGGFTGDLRSSGVSVDDFGTFFWGNAVGFMFHQSGRTLAAWNTWFKAVRLDHAQRHVLVEAGFWTRRTAFIKNITAIHRTAHSYTTGHRGTLLKCYLGIKWCEHLIRSGNELAFHFQTLLNNRII